MGLQFAFGRWQVRVTDVIDEETKEPFDGTERQVVHHHRRRRDCGEAGDDRELPTASG